MSLELDSDHREMLEASCTEVLGILKGSTLDADAYVVALRGITLAASDIYYDQNPARFGVVGWDAIARDLVTEFVEEDPEQRKDLYKTPYFAREVTTNANYHKIMDNMLRTAWAKYN